MRDLRKVVPPNREILKGIWLSFLPGAKIGVIGSNGSGKSTLLKIMAGVEKEFFGDATPAKGLRVGYLPQEPELDPSTDVRGNVEKAVAGTRALLARFEEVSTLMGTAEGGVLLEKPDLLLLDEPTNHLDADSVAWLERFLHDYPGTVVAITHDRYFLDNVAGWILELDRGEGIPFEGNYTGWLAKKQQRLALEEKKESARQRTLLRELEWVQMAPRARQAKSKARLQAYETLLEQSKTEKAVQAEIVIPPGPRLGDVVIEAQHLGKSFGDRVLIEDLSFALPPGGIVGVIGPNGAGKSTLFRMIN
ncbi:MAG: ATP-binding cassette domain-containing protein, partial [Myxococcales bacterium]